MKMANPLCCEIFALLVTAVTIITEIKAENVCETGDVDPNGGVFPHESDCSSFYMCEWGKPVRFECPAGLHFNPTTSECDWPEQAGCEKRTIVPEQDRPCEEGRSVRPELPPPPVCPEHDPDLPAVHLPHPDDCSQYYQCDWGVPHPRRCPEGLHFNAALQVCDWPASAGCACPEGGGILN